jgi:hypothetical protein
MKDGKKTRRQVAAAKLWKSMLISHTLSVTARKCSSSMRSSM